MAEKKKDKKKTSHRLPCEVTREVLFLEAQTLSVAFFFVTETKNKRLVLRRAPSVSPSVLMGVFLEPVSSPHPWTSEGGIQGGYSSDFPRLLTARWEGRLWKKVR